MNSPDLKDWTEDAFALFTPEEAVAAFCVIALLVVVFKDYVL